jgi:hypothetical protein
MKTFKTYCLILILTGLTLISCDEQAPIELIDDAVQDNSTSVEIIPETETGYDSTGTIDNEVNSGIRFTNVITATGTITTVGSLDTYKNYYSAAFYDRNSPFVINDSIWGFKGKALGDVFFDDKKAKKILNRIKYTDLGGVKKDTVFGFKHELISPRWNNQDNADLPYNSLLKFTLNPIIGNSISYSFQTPKMIYGKISIRKSGKNSKSQIRLNWNGFNHGEVKIIIGNMENIGEPIKPLYRFTTRDNGNFIFPEYITNSIDFNQNKTLAVTLIRTKSVDVNSLDGLSNSFFIAQSIHNIKINVR